MYTFNLEEKILFTPKTLYMEYILINYNRHLKKKLEDKNITPGELTFLFNIYYHESISQRELADLLFVSEAYVTKMLKKLETKGYIQRKTDKNNKSKKNVSLSKQGLLLSLDILEITKKWESHLCGGLNNVNDEELNHILYTLANNSHKI